MKIRIPGFVNVFIAPIVLCLQSPLCIVPVGIVLGSLYHFYGLTTAVVAIPAFSVVVLALDQEAWFKSEYVTIP